MAISNEVVYELLLKDGFTPGIQHATVEVDKFESHIGHVKNAMVGLLQGAGLAFAGFKVAEFINEGREAAEKLHQSEAQLVNTMQNMGTYSEEAFEKMVDGAGKLASGIKYSRSEIIELQSQLGLVGSIGEEEMERITKVSADLSTKLGTGLNEAGNLLAKAINNPEMGRRLGMALKIDPEVMKHIQDLAKHGKEAEARMELLAIAESKVGGAAQAAFKADPMAEFNKEMGKVKLMTGNAALELTKALMPVLLGFAHILQEIGGFIKEHIDLLKALAIGFTVAAVAVGAYVVATNIGALAILAIEKATWLWNAALDANPLFAVIAMIGLFVAAIVYAWDHLATFRGYILGIWETIKEFGKIVADVFIGVGKVIEGVLSFNPAMVVEGANQTVDAISNAGARMGKAFKKGFDEGMESFAKDHQKEASLIPDKGKPTKAGKDTAAGIAEPKTKATGSKSVVINVSIAKLGETHIEVTNLKEAPKKLHDAVTDALTSAVNDFQVTAEH